MTRSIGIRLEIPLLPKMPNSLLGAHWRTRSGHAAKWRKIIADELLALGWRGKPMGNAMVTLVRHSSVQPDSDGLRGSFKSVLDALVRGGVLVDDTPAVIGEPVCRWEKASPKKGKIEVTVVGEVA